MKIVDTKALVRGELLYDIAYSKGLENLTLTPADYTGLVAAYINGGHDVEVIGAELGKALHHDIGEKAASAFQLNDGLTQPNLWYYDGLSGETMFLHPTLKRRYPNARMHQLVGPDNLSVLKQR